MFGPLTTDCEKAFESHPFKLKVKDERVIPNQNKTKSHDEGHVYINYF